MANLLNIWKVSIHNLKSKAKYVHTGGTLGSCWNPPPDCKKNEWILCKISYRVYFVIGM